MAFKLLVTIVVRSVQAATTNELSFSTAQERQRAKDAIEKRYCNPQFVSTSFVEYESTSSE